MFEALPMWQIYLLIGTFFLFIVTGGIVAFVIIDRVRWKFKVTILEDSSGKNKSDVTRKDRARLIRFGDGGEEVFLLKRHKVYRVGYGKRIGHNQIAWCIGGDGYWYNVILGGLDKRLMEVGVMPVDRDIRFANASLRKGIEHRYNDKTFMEKYGVLIAFGMLFLCIIALGASTYYNWKIANNGRAIDLETAKLNKEVMEMQKQIISVATTQGGGSGIKPAT